MHINDNLTTNDRLPNYNYSSPTLCAGLVNAAGQRNGSLPDVTIDIVLLGLS